MNKRKISNINDYTLIEKKDLITDIYFYPQCSLTNQKVYSKKDQLCVLFELRKEKEQGLYLLHTFLLNKEGEKIFQAYSLYLKELEKYKYAIFRSKNDHYHAEVIKNEIIDFKTLNYDSFLEIISKNKDLVKMLPDLKMGLEDNIESLVVEKKNAITIDLPSIDNYYQNITGNIIDELVKQLTTEDELELSQETLRNFQKNYKVVLHDKYQLNLAYTAIYALILKNIKGNLIPPTEILDPKELKIDTNKTSISYEDLEYLLNSFINSIKEGTTIERDLNIIQERIEYAITIKPKLKKVTNFIKIILINDKYVDQTKRNRSIEETRLKELLISSLINYTYRLLPRNQILLYKQDEETNSVDFITIISLDKLLELLHTYQLNTKDNKEYIDILSTIDNIIYKNQHKKTPNTLKLSVYTLLHIFIYYSKYNKNILLFEKGTFIPKLDFCDGNYDISIINRHTEKEHGKLTILNDETNIAIEEALDKSEKHFNRVINDLIYKSLEISLNNLEINIDINDLTNSDIKIIINKFNSIDTFNCYFTIGELLNIFSNIKIKVNKPKIVEENIEEPIEEIVEDKKEVAEENIVEELEVIEKEERPITQEEYDFLLRKSHTIAQIMSTTNIENKTYDKVVALYNSLDKATRKEKDKIMLQIKELLK